MHQPVDALTLATKVNRLFDAHRSRGQTQQPVEHVALSVSCLIGRPISPDEIVALREGVEPVAHTDLLHGMAEHFGVPNEYLTTCGEHATQLDTQLQLMLEARDAGLTRLALRGPVNHTLDGVLAIIQKVRSERPAANIPS